MAEYTYKDIIIDPDSEEAKNAIGKICYFSDSPRTLLSEIDCKRPVEGILTNMDDGYFEVDNEGYWDCIILKKEEPKPKYVPFVNEKEFLGACYNNETEKLYGIYHYLATHGIWLKNRESEDFFMVVEIWDDGVVIGSNQFTTTWNDLRNDYTFLNGTPCGKEVKE